MCAFLSTIVTAAISRHTSTSINRLSTDASVPLLFYYIHALLFIRQFIYSTHIPICSFPLPLRSPPPSPRIPMPFRCLSGIRHSEQTVSRMRFHVSTLLPCKQWDFEETHFRKLIRLLQGVTQPISCILFIRMLPLRVIRLVNVHISSFCSAFFYSLFLYICIPSSAFFRNTSGYIRTACFLVSPIFLETGLQKRKIILFFSCRRHCNSPFRISTSAFNGVATLHVYSTHGLARIRTLQDMLMMKPMDEIHAIYVSRALPFIEYLFAFWTSPPTSTRFSGQSVRTTRIRNIHFLSFASFHVFPLLLFFPSLFGAVVIGNSDRVQFFADGVDLCRATRN